MNARPRVLCALVFCLFCLPFAAASDAKPTLPGGKVRTYYLAAVETEWNYAPGDADPMTGKPWEREGKLYTEGGKNRIEIEPNNPVRQSVSRNPAGTVPPTDRLPLHPNHLGDLFRARWMHECREPMEPPPADCEGPDWPEHVKVDFTDVDIGIARTEPGWRNLPEVRETERLHLASIAAAQRLIYLENLLVEFC